MPALTLERIGNQDVRSMMRTSTGGPIRSLLAMPVEVKEDSIVFKPSAMVIGRFYLVELKKRPYVYRRVGEAEVEVYGLAE